MKRDAERQAEDKIMSVDRTEANKLEHLMVDAEKSGDWAKVAQEVNDRKAGDFASRGMDLDETMKASAKNCKELGFPMLVIMGHDDHVQSICDSRNSDLIHNVGIQIGRDNQYHATYSK